MVIEGYRGTSDDSVVRLYSALDTSSYVEIPREAIVHLETEKGSQPGPVRAFVRASSEILAVQRSRTRASDWKRSLQEYRVRVDADKFNVDEACVGRCTGNFLTLVQRIRNLEYRYLVEDDPQRKESLRLEAERLRQQAMEGLHTCLSSCGPYFWAVEHSRRLIKSELGVDEVSWRL